MPESEMILASVSLMYVVGSSPGNIPCTCSWCIGHFSEVILGANFPCDYSVGSLSYNLQMKMR